MKTSIKNIVHAFTNSITHTIISACTLKFYLHKTQQRLLRVIRFLSLLVSGTITLKIIFRYFRHYISTKYRCINEYFEKPGCLSFQKYPCLPPFFNLNQWCIANEHVSLEQVLYAQEPRDPE